MIPVGSVSMNSISRLPRIPPFRFKCHPPYRGRFPFAKPGGDYLNVIPSMTAAGTSGALLGNGKVASGEFTIMAEGSGSPDTRAWVEKYRPVRLDQIVGNPGALRLIRSFARSWEGGKVPKKKGIIFEGEAGVGKTTTALVLAREMGWEVIELNASDARNLESIRKVATRGAISMDITDTRGYEDHSLVKRKMILMDEADNLFEKSAASAEGEEVGDRGGKRAIVELLRLTRQPVVLIVNNLYGLISGAGASLNYTCEKVKFRKLPSSTIAGRLRNICEAERIAYEDDVIKAIAERSSGDLRSAIGDLQLVCAGRKRIRVEDLAILGFRDSKQNIFNVLDRVFSAPDMKSSRNAMMELDETIDTLMLWMSENIPNVMSHPRDLDSAYQLLSRSDVYLGRVRRRQNYKLWSYAKDTLAALSIVRRHPGRRARYNFPSYLRSMSRTKESRKLLKETARALGLLTHTSMRYQKDDALMRFGLLCRRDSEFASHIMARTDLSKEHLNILTGGKLKERELSAIMDEAELVRAAISAPRGLKGDLSDFDGTESGSGSGGNAEKEENQNGGEDAASTPHQANLFDFN
ncbi:MAG TPA: replication factor C large subunit [Euryarchaeota archaeon]|nr:replication factor C large subunit [Euryarchaeota archaeon]